MTSTPDPYSGALEAIDRILNRGGGGEDVRRAVEAVLRERAGFEEAEIVAGLGQKVELRVSPEADQAGRAFLERVALLVSAYC